MLRIHQGNSSREPYSLTQMIMWSIKLAVEQWNSYLKDNCLLEVMMLQTFPLKPSIAAKNLLILFKTLFERKLRNVKALTLFSLWAMWMELQVEGWWELYQISLTWRREKSCFMAFPHLISQLHITSLTILCWIFQKLYYRVTLTEPGYFGITKDCIDIYDRTKGKNHVHMPM